MSKCFLAISPNERAHASPTICVCTMPSKIWAAFMFGGNGGSVCGTYPGFSNSPRNTFFVHFHKLLSGCAKEHVKVQT